MPVSVSSNSVTCSSSSGSSSGDVFRFTVPASRRKVWKLAQGMSLSSKNSLVIWSAVRMSQAMKST